MLHNNVENQLQSSSEVLVKPLVNRLIHHEVVQNFYLKTVSVTVLGYARSPTSRSGFDARPHGLGTGLYYHASPDAPSERNEFCSQAGLTACRRLTRRDINKIQDPFDLCASRNFEFIIMGPPSEVLVKFCEVLGKYFRSIGSG